MTTDQKVELIAEHRLAMESPEQSEQRRERIKNAKINAMIAEWKNDSQGRQK